MLIILDKKTEEKAREKLKDYFPEAVLLELETKDLVYPAISGHPDIFFFRSPRQLIISPNLPSEYIEKIKEAGIQFSFGNNPAGKDGHHSSFIRYNAASGSHHLVHRLEYTDPVILEDCHFMIKIPVKQGYTGCNLIFLNNDDYITSDKGIDNALIRAGLKGIYVSPEGIVLPGFPNGFIAGTMGIKDSSVFINGSLDKFPQGGVIHEFLAERGYKIIELHTGPLFDGGGIMFI